MSSDKSSSTISEMPELNIRKELVPLFQEAKEKHKTLPLPGLVALAQKVDVPVEELVRALAEIVKRGFAQRIVRVMSPQGGGIKDFQSVTQVPDEIYDERTGREIHVQPENLVVIYKF